MAGHYTWKGGLYAYYVEEGRTKVEKMRAF